MSLARHRTTFRRTRFLSVAVIFVVLPHSARAWGRNGNKLVVNKAIDTLPADIRAFFESNRALLSQHVTDPLDTIATKAAERHNHFLFLDKYGRFPYDALPRNYKTAVVKYGKTKLQANGLLPWQIGVYSQKLTEDMKTGRWDEANLDAAILANYVADAHDPFNTTDDFDGRLTGQTGINERFGTTLIDRYSSFSPCAQTTPRTSATPPTTPLRLASALTAGSKQYCWRIAIRALARILTMMSISITSIMRRR